MTRSQHPEVRNLSDDTLRFLLDHTRLGLLALAEIVRRKSGRAA